jgi:hypothetical protein
VRVEEAVKTSIVGGAMSSIAVDAQHGNWAIVCAVQVQLRFCYYIIDWYQHHCPSIFLCGESSLLGLEHKQRTL